MKSQNHKEKKTTWRKEMQSMLEENCIQKRCFQGGKYYLHETRREAIYNDNNRKQESTLGK